MSLACTECERLLGFSYFFPGREGVMVAPVLQSLVWEETPQGLRWRLVYCPANHRRALCLQCIADKTPQNLTETLAMIYAAYHAETVYREIKKRQEGKWTSAKDTSATDAFKEFQRAAKAFSLEACVLCGGAAREKNRPFFCCFVLDRVYCSEHTSGIFDEQNYSWSNTKTGMLEFRFCFACFHLQFPRLFAQMSYALRGQENPEQTGGAEIFVTEEFMTRLREQEEEEEN